MTKMRLMPQPIRTHKGQGQENSADCDRETNLLLACCISMRISPVTTGKANAFMSGSKITDTNGKSDASGDQAQDDPRAAALRANLAKRKQQASARRGGKAVGKKEPSVFDRLKDGQG